MTWKEVDTKQPTNQPTDQPTPDNYRTSASLPDAGYFHTHLVISGLTKDVVG